MDASYWFCVLLIGIYLFILLRRHIFVFFTRIYPFVSHLLACLLLSHCAYRGLSSTIESHRPFRSKYSYWHGGGLVFGNPHNDLLGHRGTRRNNWMSLPAGDIIWSSFNP